MRGTYLATVIHISLSTECFFVLIRNFFTSNFIEMASIDLEHNDNNWLIIYDSLSRVCTQLRFKTALQDTFAITETC